MNRRHILVALAVASVMATSVYMAAQTTPPDRARAERLFKEGNWKEAYDNFRRLCLDARTDPARVPGDLNNAVQCLFNLGRVAEFDELVEGSVREHAQNWRLLRAAAMHYQQVDKGGFLIAGKFERGPHRGGGQPANVVERDRVRAMQLMRQALPLAMVDDNKSSVGSFLLDFANVVRQHHFSDGFHLQNLTRLDELPDIETLHVGGWQAPRGAPVDEEGKPVFHTVPRSWEEATSDGQRWRWLLAQVEEVDPGRRNDVRWQFAEFLWQQFGVQTLQEMRPFGRAAGDRSEDSGTYALHTLGEQETIARLATGIKRFDLPDEFNFIRIFQGIAAEPKTGFGENAVNKLAEIFEDRRQFPKAAEHWNRSIKLYGAGNDNWKPQRLAQIVGNWARFEPVTTLPAGQGATVDLVFRNATEISFEAFRIDVPRLITDIKQYLRANPNEFDYGKIQIDNIGWRLVQENERTYLGPRVATWNQKLDPRPNHFDRRITIATPLKDPGAYLVRANLAGGNVSQIVLWVDDTVIVRKPLSGGNLYFVADSVTGRPIAGANIEFFGFRQEPVKNNRPRLITTNFAEVTDANGQLIPNNRELSNGYQWLIVARTKEGRFAHFGFRGVWTGNYHDTDYNEIKVYCITDRPVYRPGQKVHYKFWIRRAQYDNDRSDFASQTFPIELHNPKGEKIQTWSLESDRYAGIEGEWEIPATATLGTYQLFVTSRGGGSFRVEEYKKPEFEVKVEAPTEPVMLGEKITAKIEAKYYFGSPVANAVVKYKVLRNDYSRSWYPLAPWDWCYGRGYWWFNYDYTWYPGWANWAGCIRPWPWWFPVRRDPPEVVAEREVAIGADGTVSVEIDTTLAKELHGDTDHQYTITAEVRDESRRTIVGQGNVLVARQPFKVFTWVDRGYYRVGDTVRTNFLAQTLDNKPVKGRGILRLLQVTYPDPQAKDKPQETETQRWELDTNDEGRAQLQIQASAAGQYRLSYELTDGQKHKIEGGYLFTIVGPGFDGRQYRFNHLELIPDRAEYEPGETVKLQVNTDRVGSTVLLFVRPSNGVYLPPKVVRMTGKSVVEDIAIVKKDMPNFFVEAVTIADGKVHTETKEIVVPPEKRVLNVEVVPGMTTYKPGQKANVKIRLTDFNGENFVGQTVAAIYDKSVEYISGGSNVPDIKEFFWKWRRHHHSHRESSIDRMSTNLPLPNRPTMNPIGAFGDTAADELADGNVLFGAGMGGVRKSDMRFNARGLGMAPPMAPMSARAVEPQAEGFAMQTLAAGGLAADKANAAGADEVALVTPTVRSEFADTALWAGHLETNNEGVAEVSLNMPENLTTWKIRVWGLGQGTQVGSGDAEVVTRKELIVRLQSPRFFVQKDEVVLSANIHNYLATDKLVTAVLELEGGQLRPLGETTTKVMVPANSEQRVDWRVAVVEEGQATVRVKALTDEESDAMEMKLPSYVHGVLKTESWAGTVRPENDRASVRIRVPAERRVEQSLLEVRYSPTLAGAMVDALPYLAEYPYGCTEQTLNRFLPTVITQKILLQMNLNLDEIREKRTNLNAQEVGNDRERAKQWKRYDRNPVFDRAELDRMVKDGVTALTNMQCSDGGWGWFSGLGERSWPHTTAVVVHGLQVARDNDVALVPGVLERGIAWLQRYQAEQVQMIKNAPIQQRPWKNNANELDAMIYMILVDAGNENAEMREFLYRDRNGLAVYAKAMFGIGLHKVGATQREKLDMILQNLSQFVVQDEQNETAYLQLPQNNYWWYWYGSEVEANAYYLKLLSRVDGRGVTAPRLVKYLLNNRKHATYWSSTRDTAVCVEAFADYLRASGEAQPNMVVEVWLDGQKKQEVQITGENLFSFNNKFVLVAADVPEGEHVVEIRRRGQGSVYFNAYLTNFTLEDPITSAGLEVKVARKFYRLVPVDTSVKVAGNRNQPVDQKVEKYRREPLADLATLKSGELVEVELELESKNDYEYLIFEDMKAAGFEPVEVRSGYTRNGLGAYTEFRDNRVTFFIRALARGRNSVSYRLRAEIPGRFSALPAQASAMYAPELKGNSDELKLQVVD